MLTAELIGVRRKQQHQLMEIMPFRKDMLEFIEVNLIP